MLSRIRQWLAGERGGGAPADLPSVPRADAAHLWHRPDGLPRIDWDLANRWIEHRTDAVRGASDWRRAVMAACMDELRDSLPSDHRRWRSRHVEGLAPLQGTTGPAMAAIAERAFTSLHKDLRPIRGERPIPPVAVIAIEPKESYIDFTSSYFPDDGAFATSGGLYINDGDETFAIIAVSAAGRWGCEATVVHELTHHALYGARLPLWAEEGLTQMMEERIAGVSNFRLDAEMVSRHRELWDDRDIETFLDGSAFLCPDGEVQELAYHLAQWVVRGELSRRPAAFFRFASECRDGPSEDACVRHLGASPRRLVLEVIGLSE